MKSVEQENAIMKDDNMKKNILIADDSALMRRVICDIINQDSSFQVTEICRDGLEAYGKIIAGNFDAIVLDVNMPRMDGLELLKKLQQENVKVTAIMVSTLTSEGSKVTMQALEFGAVDFVTKPDNVIEAKGEDFATRLDAVLNAVLRTGRTTPVRIQKPLIRRETRPRTMNGQKIVALACSTGGPKSLQSVIPFLPKNLNAPVVIVQHMPKGFTKSMSERLNELSEVAVREACEGDVLKKGMVYVAPGGKHLEVVRNHDGSHKVHLSDAPAIGGLKPCANIMYESLKKSGYDEVICVVLTGMGADGTSGILSLQASKSIYTISQNEATCVVYGMPRAIAETGIVDKVVPLTEVAQSIITNVGVQ